MQYTTRDLQARLAALGFHPGPIDGVSGPRTRQAAEMAMAEHGADCEAGLFHPSGLHRIHWHWTAGSSGVIEMERVAYHFLIDSDGRVIEGVFKPEDNAAPIKGGYAAHTRNANSGAISVSVDAMAGAQEWPFKWGSNPLTAAQMDAMARKTAELCREYWIPVSRWSTLSHAEVQPTLGIRQRWKWDFTVLPGMSAPGDPIEVGDRIRKMVSDKLISMSAAT